MSGRVYAGIDLGGRFHQVQLTGPTGERLGAGFRIERGRSGVAQLQAQIRRQAGEDAEPVYTIEATQNYWLELVHPLKRSGASVYLVSPSKSSDLRRFYRKHTKTDAIDAAAISRVPVVDPAMREVVVSAPAVDALRRLVRQSWQRRAQIAARKRRLMAWVLAVYPGYEGVFRDRYCAASLLFIRRYLNPLRARRVGRRRIGVLLRERSCNRFNDDQASRLWDVIENAPDLLLSYEDLQFQVSQELDLLEAEERSQQALRVRIAELYAEMDPECRLLSMPGLGEFFAAAITAFIGEPGRYQRADQVVALAGLCPRKKSSAGRETTNQPLTQHGDRTLRSCLYVAAEVARHYDPELQAFYRRLIARGKHHKQAICAVAAKLLRRAFAILRDGRAYQVKHEQAIRERQEKEGKTIRESVHEVAELLNDNGGPPSLPEPVYASTRRPRKGPRAARTLASGRPRKRTEA
jgi:transposase